MQKCIRVLTKVSCSVLLTDLSKDFARNRVDTCLGYLHTHLTYARSYVVLYILQELRLTRFVGFSFCQLQPTDFVTFEIAGIEK